MKLIIFLLYNNLFIYQVLCTLIYRRHSLYSFLLVKYNGFSSFGPVQLPKWSNERRNTVTRYWCCALVNCTCFPPCDVAQLPENSLLVGCHLSQLQMARCFLERESCGKLLKLVLVFLTGNIIRWWIAYLLIPGDAFMFLRSTSSLVKVLDRRLSKFQRIYAYM